MIVVHVAFWLAAAALVYTWIGYPALLIALARTRKRAATAPASRRAKPPFLSVIVAAYNEAHCIADKLRSTLEQDYPGDRLEVVVVSDGSTDGTDDIVAAWPDRRVTLVRQEPRAGKSAALNRAVGVARGDLLVFTDANATFADGALARLAAPFADSRVGLVSGQGLYRSSARADARGVSNGYVRYEAMVRAGEAALGFLAGADGAIYALRRRLYRRLDPTHVNDFLHPIQAALAGRRSLFEPQACTLEPPSAGGGQEFRRHVRIIAQGMHLLAAWLPALLRARHWRALWMLASHRILRWASALFLVVAFATNAALLGHGRLYAATFGAQLAFYAIALAAIAGERFGVGVGRLAAPYYFCVVSVAGATALGRFLQGGVDVVWAPRGRAVKSRTA